MALNLVRNSRVFFTTNVDATTGVVKAASTTAFSSSNLFEIQVLDGFSFSQNLNNETVTLSEAGSAPVRGQRAFNTSLAPVDFSFSTYVRPRNQTTKITAEESYLWNALLCDTAIGTPNSLGAVTGVTATAAGLVSIAGTAITGTLPAVNDYIVLSGVTSTTPSGYDKYINSVGQVISSGTGGITVQLINFHTAAITATTLVTASTIKYSKAAWSESNASYSQVTTGLSDRNQLQKFGMLFLVDNVMYAVDNCALNEVTLDFGLDQIATLQWTGQATALRQFDTAVIATSSGFTGSGSGSSGVGTGGFAAKDTSANFITNKLSTVSLTAVKAIGTNISAGDSYAVPLTGGSITISNNITYITPTILGIINSPITYYTGTRAISGTLNAYLRTGTSGETGELLKDLLAETTNAAAIEPMFALTVNVGGSANTVKVALEMPSVTIGVPTVDVQQVVSTAISFNAQGSVLNATAASSTYDLTKAGELLVRYHA